MEVFGIFGQYSEISELENIVYLLYSLRRIYYIHPKGETMCCSKYITTNLLMCRCNYGENDLLRNCYIFVNSFME